MFELRTALTLVIALGVGLAWAAEPATEHAPKRLRCKSFASEPGAEVDTRDASTDLGRWVLALEDQGWEVATLELEVGPKPTGYAQAWTHVCVTPIR